MKIQNSRNSGQPLKDYSSVCHQQGRMLTDSDLTEQALISRDRLSRALQDVIGSGTPSRGALLQVTESGQQLIPSLHWGRAYVDGIPAQVRADGQAEDADKFAYQHQHYYPEAPALPDGPHRLYLDVWERSVIWLEDDGLRDPGLHGADTTARTQTMAQVKWCPADIDPLCGDVNPPIGDARLKLVLRTLSTSADPCDPCAEELELNDPVGNYLFRVEVHDVGFDADDRPQSLVLKWSSENGAEAYAGSDVPPDFADAAYVYEYFDRTSESRLGLHLGRDGSDRRLIDGQRPGLEERFDPDNPAGPYVRRWDGWCRVDKSGSDWHLTAGREGNIELPAGAAEGNQGHVTQGGAELTLELRLITLEIELADHPLVPGDYWTAPVREVIHQQGEVLLAGADGKGVSPEGEPHHYLPLVEVAADGGLSLISGSDCDPYRACLPFQFPSLTDLRAEDVCYDSKSCNLPQVGTVQQALDHLCRERDLRWHNRHLHGWGVVCGLALECDPDNPAAVRLGSGYALDCKGNDLVLDAVRTFPLAERMEKAGIDPGALDPEQGLCLYLEHDDAKGELDVGVELHQPDGRSWTDRLRDTLLLDFYQECIQGLLQKITGEIQDPDVQARCALTDCGQKEIPPVERRVRALGNLLVQLQSGTVLNVSPCEHALLEDLYRELRAHLRSNTFCGQFQDQEFPDYPFPADQPCRATWFTPQPLDHIRAHPGGRLLFGWRRYSDRIYLFENLKEGCRGDLVGWFEVPGLDGGKISDLAVTADNRLLVSGIVHEEDTLFAEGRFAEERLDAGRPSILGPQLPGRIIECALKVEWRSSFLCGVKVVEIEPSPWSPKQFFALGLCKGAYLLDSDQLFQQQKLQLEPDWAFAASGHMDFDLNGRRVVCTAAGGAASCNDYQYDRLVLFDADPGSAPQTLTPILNDLPVLGEDGLVVARSAVIGDAPDVPVDLPPGSIYTRVPTWKTTAFLVVSQGAKKILCRIDLTDPAENAELTHRAALLHHDFGEAGHIALRYVQGEGLDGVVATRYKQHDLQYIPGHPKLYAAGLLPSIPVQAGPMDIAVHAEEQRLMVLNHLGQSITLLEYDLKIYQDQRDQLQQYRTDAIAALYRLTSGLLQYLKDCFCNHLLIQCPDECAQDDKVYLGCLSLREGEIYNICNFTKRKYVKSFPTLSYWLSLIPIAPLVAWAVEQLCCLVLPDRFQQRGSHVMAMSPQQIGTVSAVMNSDHGNLMQAVSLAGKELGAKGLNELVRAGYQDRSSYADLVGSEYRYKPGVRPQVESAFTSNDAIMEKVDGMEAQRLRTEGRMTALRTEVDTLKREKAEAKAEVAELQANLVELREQKSATDAKLAELDQTRVELDRLRAGVLPLINGAKPLSSIEELSVENRTILEEHRITTVKQLADADPARLRELGIVGDTADRLVVKANERLIIML